jgi:hypothetical protein
MTLVGHTLTGVAIGVLCLPKHTTTPWKIFYFAFFMILPNIPDIPIRNWGHDRYDISHSLFVNLLFIMIFLIFLGIFTHIRTRIGNYCVMVGGSFAWLSHLLLDSFYNHGKGIAIYWPFSQARLVFPIPWFSVLPSSPPPFTPQILRIYLIELLAYFPVLFVAILIKIYLFQGVSYTKSQS